MSLLSLKEYHKYFSLKPVKAAKVSEISERTSLADIPTKDKLNFHIGNPVIDNELSDYYLKALFGSADKKEGKFADIICNSRLSKREVMQAELLKKIAENCSTYMPRGGYSSKNPNKLIKQFENWLVKNQQEPLKYGIGENGSKREAIITSGGINETLRVIFFALEKYFKEDSVNIFVIDIDVPAYLQDIGKINCVKIDEKKNSLLNILKEKTFSKQAAFLISGRIFSEEERRSLRRILLEKPLMIIEANDAPNHLSIAREARLEDRVIRILSPKIFSQKLNHNVLSFICGNQDYIKIFEIIHFQLLGTPSAAEVELLSFLIEKKDEIENKNPKSFEPEKIFINKTREINSAENYLNVAESINLKIKNINKKLERYRGFVNRKLENYLEVTDRHLTTDSYLNGISGTEILKKYLNFDYEMINEIESAFLSEFIKHHSEYKKENSFAVSGSARTALALLGFHCGIEEVVIPDLSWTYEHCFPKVNAVPLKKGFELDDKAIIEFVEAKIGKETEWRKKSAVIINNPHNASGQVFAEEKIINLLKYLLNNRIYLIDDLSYQNVAPNNGRLNVARTLKQITSDLVKKGYIAKEKEKYLITVHSLSKTDCFAGARLSVINILDKTLKDKFQKLLKNINPNYTAILLAYLFYRNDSEIVNNFWKTRNKVFSKRMNGIIKACNNISKERNFFDIKITSPVGSMYPQLIVDKLPSGLSLDWLAAGLAARGTGMIPLTTFARTEKGFGIARKMFRLTLGGTDNSEDLERKTRRLIIDLNRLISEETAKYKLNKPGVKSEYQLIAGESGKNEFRKITENIKLLAVKDFQKRSCSLFSRLNLEELKTDFIDRYLPERIAIFEQRFNDQFTNLKFVTKKVRNNEQKEIIYNLADELYKDNIDNRSEVFRKRLFDRTVHPTQVYSIKPELLLNKITDMVLRKRYINSNIIKQLSTALIDEYLGFNVAIKSAEEADELIADLETFILSEDYLFFAADEKLNLLLSFWGDWDGSNRPSGQGHRLVAAAVVENVNRMSELLRVLIENDPVVKISEEFKKEIENLEEENKKFWKLLNKITQLTNQLEKRYQSLLPYEVKAGKFKKTLIKLRLAKDPITSLWQHNDSLERKMIFLRSERKQRLQKYFDLNKKLRKELHKLLPEIENNLGNEKVLIEVVRYKNILRRFMLTPRIHQKLITAKDQFSIDTTVHNIIEINEISGLYGNPGMVMALQVSMSTKAEALISLDRKLRSKREEILRQNPKAVIPSIWIIPLFEDLDSVNGVVEYLNKVWEYSVQARGLEQEIKERFLEVICEIFIAGSDLSQQIGQTSSANLYNKVKYNVLKWLAKKGITSEVRMKLGSGEPMQRQGGYYNKYSGKRAFANSENHRKDLRNSLSDAAFKSTKYATTPLLGVASRGDLRTFQSNISENLRMLSTNERSSLFYHIQKAQQKYGNDLARATEPVTQTRYSFEEKRNDDLERLTLGNKEKIYLEFAETTKTNFQNILYGSNQDVVGIHLVSYFISRTTPVLRDRPTVRPSKETGNNRGQQIIEKIAKTIPMNRQGSALRAIGHNRAQTVILGVNQLTTGLFRSLTELSSRYSYNGNISPIVEDTVLPELPVYEILSTLRMYQDCNLEIINKIYDAFPAGNSAFLKLREDMDEMHRYIGLFQKELMRRHGINTLEFFVNNRFNEKLLPSLRPDLAVLLQNNLFNIEIENLLPKFESIPDTEWIKEVKQLLDIPRQVKLWRKQIWELLFNPVYQQVKSFVELAVALNSLSDSKTGKEIKLTNGNSPVIKLDQNITDLLKGRVDDSMRQFLQAAVHYLTSFTENRKEVPIDIVRAIKDVERILKIEEQALNSNQQKLFNFYILQIARLCGENG